ncbi:MAG: FkbM family methyltransferase [Bacteroidia bacterium]|jgi:FkbM family methyltransferase|nr:FkbM family methyltransferase [Bacteroidia bacterium]GIV22795.1 MAG: hypothetical protein KatS3mg025_0454 [Bacteroidia bacterium]
MPYVRGKRWIDTLALGINLAFWLPRRWWWQWRLGSRTAAWKKLMERPHYHWSRWPVSLKGRWFRLPTGIYADEAGLIWSIAQKQGDRFPSHWLKKLSTSEVGMDIGAHRGYWTLTYARNAPTLQQVFLFEPHPENYAYLLQNLARNHFSQAIPLPYAVWNKPTRLELRAQPAQTEHASFGFTVTEKSTGSIPATSADAFVKALAVKRLDWIKIDAEGAEVAIVEGAQETLQTLRPTLWMEIHDTWEEIEKKLHAVGYVIREAIRHRSEGPYKETGYLWAEPA